MARTLPIRLAPIPGEALDSWLEALSHRTNTSWTDLLAAVGLLPPRGTSIGRFVVQTMPQESAAVAKATGIDAVRVEAMTLARFDGRALRIEPRTYTLEPTFPWGRVRGSRFCPACLAETGGRWQLRWRLGWSFACLKHSCLLSDICPICCRVQRLGSFPGELVPYPGRCMNPSVSDVGRRAARCGADLTRAEVLVFKGDHPVLAAQRCIDGIVDIGTGPIDFGVYRLRPQPGIQVLADLRAVAVRVMSYPCSTDLEGVVTPDVFTPCRCGRDEQSASVSKQGLVMPRNAATIARGVTAALGMLNQPDTASAGEAMRGLITMTRNAGSEVTASNLGWGRGTTDTLTAVQLKALDPFLKPSDQLRYRVATVLPGRPSSTTAKSLEQYARHIPAALWPVWSLRLALPGCHQRTLRPAISAALLLIGTRASLPQACALLDSPINGQAVSRILQLLQRNSWISIRFALIEMADILVGTTIPIDYHRRRQIDCTALLPDSEWIRMCRDIGSRKGTTVSALAARCYLYEKLTGNEASTAPFAVDSNAFRTKITEFPEQLTPEVSSALIDHGREFLAAAGIDNEPVQWQPAPLLDLEALPGADPAAVDIAMLHSLIRHHDRPLGQAASTLGTTLDIARYLLDHNPAPSTCRRSRQLGAYRDAREALSPNEFFDLYTTQRLSLRQIATRIGVSRQVLARLARDYGITLDEPGRQIRSAIDRDWLYAEYVTHHRTLPDIAKECDITPANLSLRARALGIPLRGRGGPSHQANLTTIAAAAQAPKLIRPALREIGGWERLQRLADASEYRTLREAAENLGLSQSTLVNQINRLEHELGNRVLVRARPRSPMQLTRAGARVIVAIRAYVLQGGPTLLGTEDVTAEHGPPPSPEPGGL
ncbi:regulatory helix-turn-helix protein, lysR family [Mycobacteroides abscessus subsp. bolletii]|nr:regulatory helix-turn-helix protein, lysR family [Mycobacteroides abscessus subsp. bolletii]SLF65715.1 regulatory helix-turn-helix protein, lysR family [Mycobacteroides abscessus subsp. bolletii]